MHFFLEELGEEVYMDLPLGVEGMCNNEKVCKLKKSFQGLKQSPRAWIERFTRSLLRFGYYQNQDDHATYFRCFKD